MQSIGAVRVSKIKIKKDKHGEKFATIELTRVLEDDDKITVLQEKISQDMRQLGHIQQVKLREFVPQQNLIFWAVPGIEKPSEMVHGAELSNFRIKRDGEPDSEDAELLMSFEFMLPLAHARQWLIPAIGDDIFLAIEESQMRIDETK